MTSERDLIGRGESINILAGRPLSPHTDGYIRWYQRIDREVQSGRLGEHREGRLKYYARAEVIALGEELREAGVLNRGSHKRAKEATRSRMKRRGLVPLGEAATRLGITPGSLRCRVSRGVIEAVYVDRQLFFTKGELAQAAPRRAKRGPSRKVPCALCGKPVEKTASQIAASEHHFCCDKHRLEWLRAETKAKRITRRDRPDGAQGRRNKSDAMLREWKNGKRDREQIRKLGTAAENGKHWTRKRETFVNGVDKGTRTRYGHGLSDERKRELGRRFNRRAQETTPRVQVSRSEVLEGLARGLTLSAIANELGKDVRSVRRVARAAGIAPQLPGRPRGK